jgi:hypothetical protein
MRKVTGRLGILALLGAASSSFAATFVHDAEVWFCAGGPTVHVDCTSTMEGNNNNFFDYYDRRCKLTKKVFTTTTTLEDITVPDDDVSGNSTNSWTFSKIITTSSRISYCAFNKGRYKKLATGQTPSQTDGTDCGNYSGGGPIS